ncbi:hypothetical protein [Paenibacillus pinihumi]|uniref:hypothetical protein n=1 Tax=Paenibacillus pinihumi TaxID=669462 RepID=UPI0012B58152|nr:hypothetical protein [Paenibacillus pinihumi]
MSVILYSVSIILFIFVLQEILKIINIDLELTLRHIITFCSMAVLTVLTLLCLTYLFKNVNQTNYILKKTHSRRYAKIYIFAVVLLTLILLLSEMFELVGSIQYPLVLMSFLLITLLTKMAFINLLTLETYGYFLFYLKSAETPLQENIIKNIQMNNYLILLPVLLIHLTYFLIAGDPVFTGILLALYILDIKVDELVVYITRKVVKKNELPNLFIHTKKGLSTVLLIAFIPVALISFTIKSNQPVSASIGISIFVSLLLLLACVFLIARIWKQSFFKDLFK